MNISSISFGKIYLGKTAVRNNQTGRKEMLDFVQYDSKDDIKKIKKTSEKWGNPKIINGVYAKYIARHLEKNIKAKNKNYRYFGIEDKNKRIQALCEFWSDTSNLKGASNGTIEYITVNPKNSHSSRKRKYSKLGVSLYKGIVKIAKKEKLKYLWLIDTSKGFWEKMPYLKKDNKNFNIRTMNDRYYDDCLQKLDEII